MRSRPGCAAPGVLVALTADYPATRPHHLPICAGLCVRAGMPAADAFRAVTADAARLLGLHNVCGALRPGLRADLTLYDGDPLRLASALRGRLYRRGACMEKVNVFGRWNGFVR